MHLGSSRLYLGLQPEKFGNHWTIGYGSFMFFSRVGRNDIPYHFYFYLNKWPSDIALLRGQHGKNSPPPIKLWVLWSSWRLGSVTSSRCALCPIMWRAFPLRRWSKLFVSIQVSFFPVIANHNKM